MEFGVGAESKPPFIIIIFFLTEGYQFGHKQQMSVTMHKCPCSHANTTIEIKMCLHEYL